MSITREEWLAELEAIISAPGVDGMTAAELARATGRSTKFVHSGLGVLIEAGKWEMVGKRREFRIDGAPCWKPVYRVKVKP